MENIKFLSLFGGIPFISPQFKINKFLLAICCSRYSKYEHKIDTLEVEAAKSFLSPILAKEILNSVNESNIIDYREMTNDSLALIFHNLNEIISIMPEWKYLLNIPLKICYLNNKNIISCSCYAYPQHIFLSEKALKSNIEIKEQLLHEISHIWMYMIEELWRLHLDNVKPIFILPSGTNEKNALEVLGAAHVSSTLLTWYKIFPGNWEERLIFLENYGKGCLSLIESFDNFSQTGLVIKAALESYFYSK